MRQAEFASQGSGSWQRTQDFRRVPESRLQDASVELIAVSDFPSDLEEETLHLLQPSKQLALAKAEAMLLDKWPSALQQLMPAPGIMMPPRHRPGQGAGADLSMDHSCSSRKEPTVKTGLAGHSQCSPTKRRFKFDCCFNRGTAASWALCFVINKPVQ